MEHIRKIYNLAYLKIHTPNNTIQIAELYKNTLYEVFAQTVEDTTERLSASTELSDEIMTKLWKILKNAETHKEDAYTKKSKVLSEIIDTLTDFAKQYSFSLEHRFCSLLCVAVAEAIEIILFKKGENNGKLEKSA